MHDVFDLADDLGPNKIVHIHKPRAGLRAVVAIDNVARGPALGGVRMAPDVTVEEAARLARAMTMKNAAAGLRHGGGKAVIFADPRRPPAEKERILRAFAREIADLTEYVPGPDMGTDELCMAWVHDEIGRAAGLPRAIGGIPIDEIGATGRGLAAAAEVAAELLGLSLRGARFVVQGFGAVGQHAARALVERGAKLVAASDTHGAVVDPAGLDVAALADAKRAGRSVGEYARGGRLERDLLVDVPCEIWIPAARPDVIRGDNAARLETKLVLQGANIPCTDEAERILHARGVVVVPDFIANAGGVIAASVELHGGDETEALAILDRKIRENTRAVLEHARKAGVLPRVAALALAEARVRAAMGLHRFG